MTKVTYLQISSVTCVIVLSLVYLIAFAIQAARQVSGQGSTACPSGQSPGSTGKQNAWPQNTVVTVNIDSNSFTQTTFDNCIKPVFDAYNLANGSSQGNFSGVRSQLPVAQMQ